MLNSIFITLNGWALCFCSVSYRAGVCFGGGAYLVGVRWIYVHAQLHTRGFLEQRANQYTQ